MSDTEDEREITRLLPFFYPSSPSTAPNPTAAAARLVKHLEAEPIGAAALAMDLSTFLLHIATARPAHIDHILQTVQILLKTPSLPRINNPAFYHITTFEEMFQVSFQEDVDDAIGRTIQVGDNAMHLASSLLAARARNIGILNTPEILGSLGEGLGFSDDVVHSYQGTEAKIACVGSCIQLLCGALPLLRDQPKRFAKGRILAALDGLQISSIDPLIKVRFHFMVLNVTISIHIVSNMLAGLHKKSADILGCRVNIILYRRNTLGVPNRLYMFPIHLISTRTFLHLARTFLC